MELMKKPSDETLKHIDFVIQGIENGKYKELAKEVEFHQKLKGEDDPNYFQSLIFALEAAQIDITKLENLTIQQDNDIRQAKIDLETEYQKVQTLENDVKVIAKGIKYLMNPEPLEKNYELNEISNWMSNKGIY